MGSSWEDAVCDTGQTFTGAEYPDCPCRCKYFVHTRMVAGVLYCKEVPL